MSMIAAHDLRSEAKDYRRVKAHNSKWARGSRPSPGAWCSHGLPQLPLPSCNECNKRPGRDSTRNYTSLKQAENKREVARNNTMIKKAFRGVVVEAVDDNHDGLSDSSGDFDVNDASAAPELKEVMYSYDAPTGPSRGSEILSFAITQAVQRYENHETEKIVKKEYDLVLDGKDEQESYIADVDDDYELIDVSHFK